MKHTHFLFGTALMALATASPALSQSNGAQSNGAQSNGAQSNGTQSDKTDPVTPFADIRYRLELVDQDGLTEDATASTMRIRAGLRTQEWNGLSALIEGEAILPIGRQNYNDTVNGNTAYPVVADPSDVALNQAWLKWKPTDGVELTGGRQRINIGNQRWVGSVGWRQNDQTLDAARFGARPAEGLSLDYFYARRVNRIYGPDSPKGIWRRTNIHSARVDYKLKPLGTVSVYGLWLDIPAAAATSSRTMGVRLAGQQGAGEIKLTYAAEYARQTDHGPNPNDYSLYYWQVEPGIAAGPASLKLGIEHLGGDGNVGLQTPLATLHAFNGWSDKFLNTPANGLCDLYIKARYKFSAGTPLAGLSLGVDWHDFNSARLGINYGQEWGAVATLPVHRQITLQAKISRYDADSFASDTTKIWFAINAKL